MRSPWVGTVLGVSLVLVVSTTAVGGHWRNEAGLYKGDDRSGTIDWQQCDLNARFHDAWHLNNDHDIEPTDIVVTTGHLCESDDYRVNDYDYGANGFKGWWECHELVDADMCDRGHVHINLYYGPYTDGEALHVMCQEIGHSIGLGHRPNTAGDTCMDQTATTKKHFDSHDTNVVNEKY